MNTYLAVDIGGSFIKYGLVSENGDIFQEGKIKTPETIRDLKKEVGRLAEQPTSLKAVAVSLPGAVTVTGFIEGSSALPYLHGPNIKELFEEATRLPVYMENDANCAAYAEVWKGAATEVRDMLAVVIGTGIGGAIVKNGELHRGAHLHGGEFGYMLLNSADSGGEDTWSSLASTQALVQRFAKAKQHPVEKYSGEEVFHLAEKMDPDALKAVDEFYHYLAVGIYNLQYMYDPALITIGGGISAREDLIEHLNGKIDVLLKRLPIATVKPELAASRFRQHSNLLGAVYHAIREQGEH